MALGGVEIGSDMAHEAATATPIIMVEVPPMASSECPIPAQTTVRIGISNAAVAVLLRCAVNVVATNGAETK